MAKPFHAIVNLRICSKKKKQKKRIAGGNRLCISQSTMHFDCFGFTEPIPKITSVFCMNDCVNRNAATDGNKWNTHRVTQSERDREGERERERQIYDSWICLLLSNFSPKSTEFDLLRSENAHTTTRTRISRIFSPRFSMWNRTRMISE